MASTNPKILLSTTLAGIILSTCFTSANYAISFHGIPAILLPAPPSTPVPQSTEKSSAQKPSSTGSGPDTRPDSSDSSLALKRQYLYDHGRDVFAPMAILAAGLYAYTAVFQPLPLTTLTPKKTLYIAAALLHLCVAPFTFTAMAGTNHELHRRYELAVKGLSEDESVRGARPRGALERETTPDLVRWWARLNIMRATIPLAGVGAAVGALLL